MTRLIALLLSFLLASGPALAGAWLREQNKAFTTLSVTGFREKDGAIAYKTSLYAEWGMRPNLTLGLDAEEHRDLYGHALVFARVPVAEFEEAGRFAAEFGIGAHHRQLQAWATYKATLSWGKGFQTRVGGGWMAVDASFEYRTHEAVIRKLDFTAGLSSPRRIDPLLQIETSYVSGRPFYWSARPSIMYRPKDGPNTWLVGLEKNSFEESVGLKLSLWRDF